MTALRRSRRRELGSTGLDCAASSGSAARPSATCIASCADEDAGAAVRESFAAGVRYFDTAPFYGFGLSEAAARPGVAVARSLCR